MPLLTSDFMARLDRLDLVSRKVLAGKLRGERRSKRRGQSVEFADFRTYVPGDDLRFIDWNVYARLDKLFLKLFQEEEDLALYVLVDASASMRYGDPDKLDYAKRLAAAVCYVGLVNYNRVEVAALGDRVLASTGPLRGRRRVPHMLDFLDKLEPAGAGDLAGATRRFALAHPARGVLVVVSDFLDKGGFDRALKYVSNGRYDLFCLQLLAPQELEPDLVGDLKLRDVEDGDTAEVSVSAPLVARYKQTLAAYCLGLKTYLARRGGVYLFSSTAVPAESVVLNYLRERRLVG